MFALTDFSLPSLPPLADEDVWKILGTILGAALLYLWKHRESKGGDDEPTADG